MKQAEFDRFDLNRSQRERKHRKRKLEARQFAADSVSNLDWVEEPGMPHCSCDECQMPDPLLYDEEFND